MDFDRRVKEIIDTAETALAMLANEAASNKDYARATALLAMAQRVSDMAKGNSAAPVNRPAALHFIGEPAVNGSGPADRDHAPPPTAGRKPNSQYPRFKREEDHLVKIGWSKSEKATYEHRSPRDVLDRLVARIVEMGAHDRRFTTEQLMPLHDAQGAELPSYQAYLCLAWLVTAGLIERHGRQGYTVVDSENLTNSVETTWQALPRR